MGSHPFWAHIAPGKKEEEKSKVVRISRKCKLYLHAILLNISLSSDFAHKNNPTFLNQHTQT
jgi:hypothetical protein